MKTLIQTVANDLIRSGWEQLANYTIVFPMQRAGLYLTECLKEEMKQQGITDPVRMPVITTINGLTDSLCPYYQEEEIYSICRLYRIYRKHTDPLFGANDPRREGMTLDIFYSWGRQLLTDFSNVDMAMLDAKALFANSSAAHELEGVDISEETKERLLALLGREQENVEEDSIRCYIDNLWKVLPDIYEEFTREMMDQHQVALPGGRLKYVVDNFKDCAQSLAQRQIVFVGFNYLLAGERRLMECCKQMGNTRFYWDERRKFQTNPGAYQFIRENIDVYGFKNSLEESDPTGVRGVQVVASQSAAAQAQYAHDWLLEHHKQGEKTAIVIADESMLEQVVYALPAELSDQINITKGFPLRNTRVYQDVVNWLTDLQHERTGEETYADVLNRLLRDVLEPMERKEYQQNKEKGVPDTWQHALVLESLYQTRRVLNRFKTLVEDEIKDYVVSLKTLRNVVCRHLEGVSLPFHGEPVTDIQIIGVLETRLLDFDHLLILNVEEGVLPSVPKDHSFIPFYLRKYYRMQTSDEEALIYAYNFFRLFRRCEDVTLLFTNSIEGDNKRSMSRFLMQILTSLEEFHPSKKSITESAQVTNNCPMQLCDTEHTRFTGNSLSPSALNTYISCPLQFYLDRMRHIEEPEESSLLYSSAEIGNLVHATLQSIYSHLAEGKTRPCRIDPTWLDEYLRDDEHPLRGMLEKAYKVENQNYQQQNPNHQGDYYQADKHLLENHVIMEQVRKVLRRDRTQAESLLEIVMLEQDQRFEMSVSLSDGSTKMVRIGGKIDRLDIVLENGVRTLRILDYKSGKYKPEKLGVPNLDKLMQDASSYGYVNQTMLYSLLCTQREDLNTEKLPIMPQLMFTQIEEGDMHVFVGTAKKHTLVTDFATQYQAQYEKLLMDKVKELYECSFTDSESLKCAEDKCSSFCPYFTLCGREKKKYN